MTELLYLEAARLELFEAASYYEAQRSGLGRRFLDDVRQAIDFIRSFPQASPILHDEVRRKDLRTFPYRVLYSIESDHLVIVAVMHQRRRPDYWRSRLA